MRLQAPAVPSSGSVARVVLLLDVLAALAVATASLVRRARRRIPAH